MYDILQRYPKSIREMQIEAAEKLIILKLVYEKIHIVLYI